ncbi:MAG: hypothetical protein ACE5Z5_02970 [Candidatus Bathyarchaeia archaeon]
MWKRFLVQGPLDEDELREALASILLGVERTTHKTRYRTTEGVVEYVSIPLGSNPTKYADAGTPDALRKILLWNREDTDNLEETLRSSGVEMVEIIRDGPKGLELGR